MHTNTQVYEHTRIEKGLKRNTPNCPKDACVRESCPVRRDHLKIDLLHFYKSCVTFMKLFKS